MNADAAAIVRALVELSASVPQGEKLLREIRDLLSERVRGEGQIAVTLITPSGHEPHLATAVAHLVEKQKGGAVTITERSDPSLIGGAILQVGDEQIDLSVRGSLHDLEASLRASPV